MSGADGMGRGADAGTRRRCIVARGAMHLGNLDHDVKARLVDALAEHGVLGLAGGEPVKEIVFDDCGVG